MTKKEILEIVERKEEDKLFLKRCLNTGTCPECGGDLTCKFQGCSYDDYKCKVCGAKFND